MSDRNGASSGFDPRFNPAFQPGYDPAVHGAAQQPEGGSSPRATGGTDAAAPAFVVGPPSAAQGRTAQPSTAQASIVPPPTAEQFFAEQFAGAQPEPLVETPAAAAETAVEPEPATAPSRVNPLVIALWVLSVLFVGVGLYGLRFIDERVTQLSTAGGFGNADYYLLQAYATGAPMLIVLGLATATGTLFFYASRWRGRAKPGA